MTLDFAKIRAAQDRIRAHVHRTPVLTSGRLDDASGASLFFKCENFQKVGAFKARGATNAVFSLDDATARRGVATHSSGNHGTALARAAKLRGIPAHIVMPSNSAKVKVRAVESYGARIVFCEPTQEAREVACADVIAKTGATLIHSFENEDVMAGQGTAVVELLEDVSPKQIQSVTDYLFARLVNEDSKEEAEGKAAKEVRDELLIEADVALDERVKIDKRVPIRLRDNSLVHPEFHLYIGNGAPELLGQVLSLAAHPKAVRTTAESITWKFERAIDTGTLKEGRAVAFVYSPEERDDELIDESLVELKTVARVFNLRMDRGQAVKAIREWVQSTEKHAS